MIKRYIIEADDSLKGFDEAIEKLEREWGAEEIESFEDCVKREDAQDIMARLLSDYLHDEYREKIENANAEIGELPSVQPQPVDCSEQGSPYCLGHCPYEPQLKRGKWIFNENMHDYCCSECGCLMPSVNEYYRKKIIGCPYCLADMREGDKE